MCAIHGYCWQDEKLIGEMLCKAHHRGPDGQGTFFNDDISLGCNGKISKFLNDNSLLNQIWIMDPKKKVSDILKENSLDKPLQVIDFVRYKVGEGV